MEIKKNKNSRILITGGAGFIGSNLVDHFLEKGHEVVVLDNLSTGFEKNISHNIGKANFTFIQGDIRDPEVCREAVKGCDLVSHQAALGSVPRSLKDPLTTNEVNVTGFLNMLIATRDEGIKRFVYAASSSTYGDSEALPKVEDVIGKPLSPYAVTKYVNELYADVFARTWNMECIGLRYFNVFGKRQDPNGAYAAVIPLWVKNFLKHESPVINGDGSYSRDFTYIENVIQANDLALLTPTEKICKRLVKWKDRKPATCNLQPATFHEVFNIAYGDSTTLLQLFDALRDNLAKFDSRIADIEPGFRDFREGDIPHSLASIDKAKTILGYTPEFDAKRGFDEVAEWYFTKLK